MTLDEFMDALSKTPRDWHLRRPGDAIRRYSEMRPLCPLAAVGGDLRLVSMIHANAAALGIGFDLAHEIASAADNADDHDPELRARLLKACGLSP